MEAENTYVDDKTKRMRDLLSSFYSPDIHSSTSLSKSSTVDAINSSSFNADLYMNHLVETLNLPGLLRRHVEMAAEIKNLDTDLQMLVYENYNKFINATETIKRMKNNVVGMEISMEQLLEKILSVQSKSDKINTSLFAKRESVEKLHRTRNLLHKVQFIYDLPIRLKTCIQSEAYADAVRYFIGAMPILERYGESSFQDCKRQSEEAMATVTRNLQSRVCSEDMPVAIRAEAVTLLKQLNFPVGSLKLQLLERLELTLSEIQIEFRRKNAISADCITMPSEVEVNPREAPLFQTSIKSFADNIHAYRIIFPDLEGRLVDLAQGLLVQQFVVVHKMIADGIPVSDLLEIIGILCIDVGFLDEVLPEASLSSFVLEAVQESIKRYISSLFTNLLSSVSDVVNVPAWDSQTNGRAVLQLTMESGKRTVLQGSMDVLLAFCRLLGSNVDLLQQLHDFIVRQVEEGFQEFFLSLDNLFLLLAGRHVSVKQKPTSVVGTQHDKMPGGLVLILSQLSFFIEQTAIPRIMEETSGSFYGGGFGKGKNEFLFAPGPVRQMFHAAGEKFLHLYVSTKSKKISNLLRKRYTTPNWIKHKEPREVHMFVDLFLDEVNCVRKEVAQILPYGAPKHRRSGSAGSAGSSWSNSVHDDKVNRPNTQRNRSQFLESHLAKLFKQKVDIFTKVEATQVSVVSTIVKRCLKSLQELVRLQTFNRSGFQQIQLDIQFLRSPLIEVTQDDAGVDFLLDEVVVAASERCQDAVPLEAPILDRLIKAKMSVTNEGTQGL